MAEKNAFTSPVISWKDFLDITSDWGETVPAGEDLEDHYLRLAELMHGLGTVYLLGHRYVTRED
jgi:hypothetical protein